MHPHALNQNRVTRHGINIYAVRNGLWASALCTEGKPLQQALEAVDAALQDRKVLSSLVIMDVFQGCPLQLVELVKFAEDTHVVATEGFNFCTLHVRDMFMHRFYEATPENIERLRDFNASTFETLLLEKRHRIESEMHSTQWKEFAQ
jgi:hypothetical protein